MFKQEQQPSEGLNGRGVPESTSKFDRELNQHDMRENSKMLHFLSI